MEKTRPIVTWVVLHVEIAIFDRFTRFLHVLIVLIVLHFQSSYNFISTNSSLTPDVSPEIGKF